MHQVYQLDYRSAAKILDAIVTELERERKGAVVAVVDSHGELLAFARTDSCRLPSINIAINKAFTAARELNDSKAVGNASRTENFPMTNFGDLRYTAWGGGIPIRYHGQVIGAVGVSGLPEDEDIRLANLGVSVLSE